MSNYAARTTVPVSKTVTELDTLVSKYGATGFAFVRDDAAQTTRVLFRIADRMVRFEVTQADPSDYRRTANARSRSIPQQNEMAAAEDRRRWRSLLLVVKALLVGVSDGVISLHDAFLPYTVLPGGDTVGEWAEAQLDTAYALGHVPELLPGGLAPARKAIAL